MCFDLIWLLNYREIGTPIMLFHHAVSILAFPYAVLQHRCVVFVLFFLLTEVTGVLQHPRMILLKLGLDGNLCYVAVGAGWTISFFFVRIAPSPVLLYALLRTPDEWQAFSTFDFAVAVSTVPLPFLLNGYWFYALVAGLLKFLRKQQQQQQQQQQPAAPRPGYTELT